jgi:hypothetical protein
MPLRSDDSAGRLAMRRLCDCQFAVVLSECHANGPAHRAKVATRSTPRSIDGAVPAVEAAVSQVRSGLDSSLGCLADEVHRFNLSTPVKNYYSFHAGLYFDTVIEKALCSWPEMPGFQSFSFIQGKLSPFRRTRSLFAADLPPVLPPVEIEELTLELGRLDISKSVDKDKAYFAQPLVLFRHSFAIVRFPFSRTKTDNRDRPPLPLRNWLSISSTCESGCRTALS